MNYEGKEGINTMAPQGLIFIWFVADNLLRKRLISEASIYFCRKSSTHKAIIMGSSPDV